MRACYIVLSRALARTLSSTALRFHPGINTIDEGITYIEIISE
jgi:hypothetical protein